MSIYEMLLTKGIMGESGGGGGGGSSDFSTAQVTVVNNTATVAFYAPCYYDDGDDSCADVMTSATNNIILYKGIAYALLSEPATAVATGSIEVADTVIIITGDGTITISE